MTRMSLPLLLSLLMIATFGCSFSDSSSSISKSISGSSSSSSPASAETAYREDVRDYTQAYVTSGGTDTKAFWADLGRLAQRHGITNWEENMTTYAGIGEGLKKAKVNEAQFLAYQKTFSGSDPRKMDAIRKGYDSAQ